MGAKILTLKVGYLEIFCKGVFECYKQFCILEIFCKGVFNMGPQNFANFGGPNKAYINSYSDYVIISLLIWHPLQNWCLAKFSGFSLFLALEALKRSMWFFGHNLVIWSKNWANDILSKNHFVIAHNLAMVLLDYAPISWARFLKLAFIFVLLGPYLTHTDSIFWLSYIIENILESSIQISGPFI